MYNFFLLLSGLETLFGGFKSDGPCLPNRCFSFLKKTSSSLKNFIAILLFLLSSLLNLSHNLVNLFFSTPQSTAEATTTTKQNLPNCRYLPTTTIEFSTLSKQKLDFSFFSGEKRRYIPVISSINFFSPLTVCDQIDPSFFQPPSTSSSSGPYCTLHSTLLLLL